MPTNAPRPHAGRVGTGAAAAALEHAREHGLLLGKGGLYGNVIRLAANTGCELHLKLENLQPINAYKLRGAANAVALLF